MPLITGGRYTREVKYYVPGTKKIMVRTILVCVLYSIKYDYWVQAVCWRDYLSHPWTGLRQYQVQKWLVGLFGSQCNSKKIFCLSLPSEISEEYLKVITWSIRLFSSCDA